MVFTPNYVESSTPCGKPELKSISWNLAVKMAEKKSLTLINRRELSVEEDYKQSKKEISKYWDSVESHIKHHVFGMPYKLLPLDDEIKSVRTVQQPLKAKTWKLTKNKFPYFYEDDVTNYVLWYENKEALKNEKESWISQCEELKNCDLLVFENSECIKSVKLIPHLHILARKCESETQKTIFGYKFDSGTSHFQPTIISQPPPNPTQTNPTESNPTQSNSKTVHRPRVRVRANSG